MDHFGYLLANEAGSRVVKLDFEFIGTYYDSPNSRIVVVLVAIGYGSKRVGLFSLCNDVTVLPKRGSRYYGI